MWYTCTYIFVYTWARAQSHRVKVEKEQLKQIMLECENRNKGTHTHTHTHTQTHTYTHRAHACIHVPACTRSGFPNLRALSRFFRKASSSKLQVEPRNANRHQAHVKHCTSCTDKHSNSLFQQFLSVQDFMPEVERFKIRYSRTS